MPASRPTWKGYLKLSLVSIPVKAFTARKSDGGEIHLNQLHRDCNNRIRYKKTCPVHGEVTADEIILGYPIGNEQYVPVEPEEVQAIRKANDQSIEIDTFIKPDQLDNRYLTERSYYLVPDGKVGQKPYTLIRDVLNENEINAVAQVVLSNRQQLVVIRPLGKLLVMTVLQHEAELKALDDFEEEVHEAVATPQEHQLTKQLIEGFAKPDWDYSDYTDEYESQLVELVNAKIEGKQLVTSPDVEAPTVINLMDALRASVEQIPLPNKKSKASAASKTTKAIEQDNVEASAKPPRKVAKSRPRNTNKSGRSRGTA